MRSKRRKAETSMTKTQITDTAPSVGTQIAHDAPAKPSSKKGTSPKKAAPKGPKATKAAKAAPRDGSKQAEVLDLMRRKQGATLAEVMKLTGWQAHTVRGFVSGTLTKKLGLKVESFRSDEKERTYRINA